ncbi:MAG: hypothetical protein Q6353_014065 [Candidatus Sigynarchaeum springense]
MIMQLERVRDIIELAILAGGGPGKRPRQAYRCAECNAPTQVMHLVPVPGPPGILKLCTGCYNAFADLVGSCRAGDWVPPDTLCRGESLPGYLARRLKWWWRKS